MGADLRQAPLLVGGEALVELASNGEPEDAVPEEFEPLVRLGSVARPRGMGERLPQALGGQPVDQPPEVGLFLALLTAGGSRCSRRPARLSGSAGRPRPRS
jgi:hypothetical protein